MTTLKNYRICFDYSAETPIKALIYMLGIIEDPGSRDIPFDWIVIDETTGEQFKFKLTLAELDAEARKNIASILNRLKKG